MKLETNNNNNNKRLEEIEDEDDPSIDVSASQPSHVIYEKEEKIKIDYNSLNSSLKVRIYSTRELSPQSNIHFILGMWRRWCQKNWKEIWKDH